MNVVPIYRLDEQHPQAQACAACDVRRMALFGAMDVDSLDHIHTYIASQDFEPDHLIQRGGDKGDSVFTIRSGIVRFERATECGERRIVRLAGRGDLIGQESLINVAHADDIVASTQVTACRIPRTLIQELSQKDPAVTTELMKRWQLALDDAQAWVAELTTGPATRRMLHLLEKLSMYPDERGEIWLPRREDMGAMLDMTFETASRLVSQLKRDGVLELLPPRHARVNQERLAELIERRAAL